MWTVFKRCYGLDLDVCWDGEYDYFDTKEEAEKFASALEESYSPKFCTPDHPWYKSKFYAWEVNEDYLRHNQYQNALLRAEGV